MASEISSVTAPVAVAKPTPVSVSSLVKAPGGNALPQGGRNQPVPVRTAEPRQPPKAPPPSDAQPLVAALNKFLNDSGRPTQFRVDPAATTQIQQINPANGEVVGEFAISEFRALAQSIGATSLLLDTHA